MGTLTGYLEYVNLGLFTLLALAALRQWQVHRSRAAVWAALTFGALALVVDVGRLLPDEPTTNLEGLVNRLLLAVLVLFPYLLYRFTTAFEPPTRRLERLLGLMTVVVLTWTFVMPSLPGPDDSWPVWFALYVAAFLVHWTVLTVVVAIRLWRAGRGQPSVARRRMRLLSLAATAITVALLLAGTDPGAGSEIDLAITLLTTTSALLFLLGLVPPSLLRAVWRAPEQRQLHAAIADLMGATSEQEVVARVLPPMVNIVGARAASLHDPDGRLIGSYGDIGATSGADHPEPKGDIVALDVPAGTLRLRTSSYAPFFGSEELRLLRTLGAMTGLALDRSRLFARERDARVALERADEVKSNFIALAAHELRTPVTVICGIVETIHHRGLRLATEQRQTLDDALRQQSDRLRLLVEQLLDLSRLDAEAVPIDPRPFPVRRQLEELVATTAGERALDVSIRVPPGLNGIADPAAFDRILSNLIVNALHYGESPVTVSADQRDRHLRIVVEDRGPGVPPDFVPDLFERFTRSRESANRAGGTGLGLAIARAYARAHRGELLYEPALPHGARFELVLPAGS